MLCIRMLRGAARAFAAHPVVVLGALAPAALLVLSCRPDGGDISSAGASGGAGGAWVTSVVGGGSNAGGGGGSWFDVPDAAPYTNDTPLADGGLFKCGACACDGNTHYCVYSDGPGPNAPPTPDAGLVPCPEPDAGYPPFECVLLPASCDSGTSCACILASAPIQCPCSDVGGGLLLKCVFP